MVPFDLKKTNKHVSNVKSDIKKYNSYLRQKTMVVIKIDLYNTFWKMRSNLAISKTFNKTKCSLLSCHTEQGLQKL